MVWWSAIGKVLLVLVVALAAFATYVAVKIRSARKLYSHLSGPKPHWLFGNLGFVAMVVKKHGTLHGAWDEFPTEDVMVVHVLHRPIVFCRRGESIKQVLVSDQPKDPQYSVLGRALLSFIDNTDHTARKAILQPFFHQHNLGQIVPNVVHETLALAHKIAATNGEYFTISQHFSNITLDVIGKTGFGVDFNAVSSPNNPLPGAVSEFLKYKFRLMAYPFHNLNLLARYRFNKALKILSDVTKRILNDHLQQSSSDGDKDLADLLLSHRDRDGKPLKVDEIISEFLVFLLAGHETSANTLEFTWLEILRQPEIIARLRAEASAELGIDADISDLAFTQRLQQLRPENIRQLKYAHAVMYESLRKYPIAPGTVRKTNSPITLSGAEIPVGTTILASFFGQGRCVEHWPEPFNFDPERFLNKDAQSSPYHSTPFSSGRRVCIGREVAVVEIKLIMAILLTLFDFELEPGQTGEVVQQLTLRPKTGVRVRAKPRRSIPTV